MNLANQTELFQSPNGMIEFRGDSEHETIWASLDQIAKLFGRDKSGISRHIKNIFSSGELEKDGVVAKIATTANDGKTYQVEYFSLDMILSIGYRVDSKEATIFRKWATSVLKKYLREGYAINELKISKTKTILNNLKQTIEFLTSKQLDENREILSLLQNYTKTLSLLESYDKANIEDFDGKTTAYEFTYDEAKNVIAQLKTNLIAKKEASELFGNEKEDQLGGIIGNLYQTFGGVELYPNIEDKASHLLYFIIKDHPFNDGNKRTASFLFVYFLDKCDYLYKQNGEKKINDNALTTLALLVAISSPNEKEILIKLIKHLIFESEL
jgi:death-on-curing family protein